MSFEKEKLKKDQPKRNKFVFLFLWLIGHVSAWGVFIPIVEMLNRTFNNFQVFMTLGLIVGGITSLTQYLLIRRQFGRNIKAWVPVSIAGWLVAMLIIYLFFQDWDGSSQIDIMLQGLLIFSPAALVQTFLLRKHIQQAWLWLLATVAGTATFTLPIAFNYGAEWSVMLGYGLYASATALSLLWLFGMSASVPQVEKDKTAHRLSDEEAQLEEQDYPADSEIKRKEAK